MIQIPPNLPPSVQSLNPQSLNPQSLNAQIPREPGPPSTTPPVEPIVPQPIPAPIELLPSPSPATTDGEIVPSASPITLKVKQFQVVGSTVFQAKDFDPITQPYLDRDISLTELYEVRSKITNLYVQRGYITSGAYIPPQKLDNGIVKIQVLEGRLEAINVTGNRNLAPSYVRSRLRVATHTPLNRDRLLRALQLLQLDPLIKNISAELSAGSRSGANILDVKISETPDWEAQVLLDNGRSPSAGQDRRKLQFADRNLLGLGDGLSVGYSNTNGSNAFDLNYTLPINPHNGTLSFSYGQSRSRVIESPFDVLNIRSKSRYYELSLRQPIVQAPTHEFAIGVSASHQRSAATLLDGELPFPAIGSDAEGKTQITSLRLFQEYSQRSRQSALALRSQFSVGLNAIDATINDQLPDGRFFSWRGQAQYVHLLAPQTLVLLRTSAQLADRALVPAEQFSLGGQDTVRGYRQDLLSIDNALFASAEARVPLLRLPQLNTLAQINPFIDFGTGINRDAAGKSRNTLLSMGLGLRLEIGDRLTGRLDWGIPLRFVSGSERSTQENRLHFSIVYNTPLK